MTILLVDDEVMRSAALIRYLREIEGFTVLQAANSSEAKYALNSNSDIDCVLLDIMMPPESIMDAIRTSNGMISGVVLGNWIRKKFPEMPIVGITAHRGHVVESWFSKHKLKLLGKPQLPHRIASEIQEAVTGQKTMKEYRIFIVHGHDGEVKWELKNYLQNTLGLTEPIILHEQASEGKTIIEKLEDEASGVDMVFVILSPDDEMATPDDSNDKKRRARQNVIFELGLFVGIMGRRSGRVVILHKGNIELPSDIQGVIYIDVTDGVTSAGEIIRREISRVGMI